MPIRFYRRFALARGLRLNVSKSGPSVSVGRKGAWFTIGPRGPRSTIGLPGTGLSYFTTKRGLALWIIGLSAIAAFVLGHRQ